MDLKGVIDLTYYIYQNTSDEGVSFDCSALNTPNYKAALQKNDASLKPICLCIYSGDSEIGAKRVMYAYLQAFLLDEHHSVDDLMTPSYELAELVDSLPQAEQMWAFEARGNADAKAQLSLGLHMTKSEAGAYIATHPDAQADLIERIVNEAPQVTENWDDGKHYLANDFFDLTKAKVDEEHVLPIMYRDYYPTGLPSGEFRKDKRISYVHGLKYTDYVPADADQEYLDHQQFDHQCLIDHHGIERYAKDFVGLLHYQPGDQFVLVGLPSSKIEKINGVHQVIEYLATTDPAHFINGNALLQRIVDGVAAHEGNNKMRRTYLHMREWDENVTVDPAFKDLPIIVVDDVLTSGSSFDAADRFLNEKLGLPLEHIMNFAYGKTMKSWVLAYLEAPVQAQPVSPLTGVIFDLDQTLFDTTKARRFDAKNPDEEEDFNATFAHSKPYDSNMLAQVSRLFLPYAIATHNKDFPVRRLLSKNTTMFEHVAISADEQPVFEFEKEQYYNKVTKLNLVLTFENLTDKNKVTHYKPEPYLIEKTIKRMDLPENGHLLGIGNTIADMCAYRAAGMTTIFANYGNRVKVPRSAVEADYFAETPEELNAMIEAEASSHPQPSVSSVPDLPF